MGRVQQSFNMKLYCLRGITIGAGIEKLTPYGGTIYFS
jgi:hypothetical protein